MAAKKKKDEKAESQSEDRIVFSKRPRRAEVSQEEILRRMEGFPKRAKKIVDAIRRARESG